MIGMSWCMWTSLQAESSVITAILVVHDEFWAGPGRSDRRPSDARTLRFTWQAGERKLSINSGAGV